MKYSCIILKDTGVQNHLAFLEKELNYDFTPKQLVTIWNRWVDNDVNKLSNNPTVEEIIETYIKIENTSKEEKFLNDTEISRVNLKKGNRALASTLAYGSDNFRNLYRGRLLEAFLKDNIYWFLDQDILDQLVSEQQVSTMFLEWTGTKMSNDQMIWTAKGDRKHTKPQYMRLINQYLEKDKE
jgi:hypothetical protein